MAKLNKGQVGELDATNLATGSVDTDELADHGTHGIDLNTDCAGNGLQYDETNNKLLVKADEDTLIVDPLDGAIKISPTYEAMIAAGSVTPAMLSYYSLGMQGMFDSSAVTSYFATKSAIAGTYEVGQFIFPGSARLGTPFALKVLGSIETASTSEHLIEVYDVTNSLRIAAVDMKSNTDVGIYSSEVISNVPTGYAIFAVRYINPSANRKTVRLRAVVLEWELV